MGRPRERSAAVLVLVGCGPSLVGDVGTTSTSTETTGAVDPVTTAPLPSTSPPTDVDVDSGITVDTGDPTTGTGEDTGTPVDPPVAQFELERIVSGGPWEIVQDAGAIAVDHAERVFIADGIAVYMIDDGVVTTWLDAMDGVIAPIDVDVDEQGVLYVLDAVARKVLVSTITHDTGELRDLQPMAGPTHFGVVTSEWIGVRGSFEGLWTTTPTETAILFGERELMGAVGCTMEDLAVQRSGVFVYQAGCNGWPMVMGHLDGLDLRIAFEHVFGEDGYTNAMCSTRAPDAGFYAVLDFDLASTTRLVYLQEDAVVGSGSAFVETTPTLDEAEQITDEPFGFSFCGIAVSSTSTLWLQTGHELWRGTPVR